MSLIRLLEDLGPNAVVLAFELGRAVLSIDLDLELHCHHILQSEPYQHAWLVEFIAK